MNTIKETEVSWWHFKPIKLKVIKIMSFMRNLWLMLYAVNDCNISNFKLIILFFYELIIWSLKFYGCSLIACVILKYFKFLPFPVPHYFLPPCAGVSLLRTLGVASIIFIKKGPLGSVRWLKVREEPWLSICIGYYAISVCACTGCPNNLTRHPFCTCVVL